MSSYRASDRDRVVRTRRSPSPSGAASALADIDRRLLGVLCAHRVVRQDQLGRLFPEIPERTLRYRTRRLHEMGLTGRTRPYREHGSAPNHHWPTRRADCLMRGERVPRGGERREPNPVFLAHATALTELYVAVFTNARSGGFKGLCYDRESNAREPFKDGMRERALAPDATLGLLDEQDRGLLAFVEIDLGTMSHTRLRAKAELYAAYAASGAWRERHPFLPALLFLTTTDIRAGKFLKALARALSYGPSLHKRRAFIAGAAGIAWTPRRLLDESCLVDLDGNGRLTLLDVLNAARAPHEQQLTDRRERREADEAKRDALLDDPEALREHLSKHEPVLAYYLQGLGPLGEQAVRLLFAAKGALSSDERAMLGTIGRDLGEQLLEPWSGDLPSPSMPAASEGKLLANVYRSAQENLVKTLAVRHGPGPSLRKAQKTLRSGALIEHDIFVALPSEAERDAAGRAEQQECRLVYEEWRERAAGQLARQAGPLGRLTHSREQFYAQLDREHLNVCGTCSETIYPGSRKPGGHLYHAPITCHYCTEPHDTRPYDPDKHAGKESEAHQ